MSNELSELSTYSSEQRAIIQGVGKCALHFRVELTDADLAIFKHALRDVELWRIEKAFERCLNECQFMPKLVDVWAKMPEPERPLEGSVLERLPASEWTECGYRFRGDPKGYRVVIGKAA